MIWVVMEGKVKTGKILLLCTIMQLMVFVLMSFANDGAANTVSDQTRCPVCGMFVAKYPNWMAQIHYADLSQTKFFDGLKDMMVFYFNPDLYDGLPREAIKEMFVKDYYSLDWLSARDAFYVIGSDIYGPMGHELIPFKSRNAAESFSKDHHAKEILTFDEITPALIESLRVGQRMR
jgi:nitrous oxide reductase accessory protein NosL